VLLSKFCLVHSGSAQPFIIKKVFSKMQSAVFGESAGDQARYAAKVANLFAIQHHTRDETFNVSHSRVSSATRDRR
jgi:hypothetical protein